MIDSALWLAAEEYWLAAGGAALLGRIVLSLEDRRTVARAVVSAAALELEQLGALLALDLAAVATFEVAMRQRIAAIHLAAAAGLRGGFAAWSARDTWAFQGLLEEQHLYLGRFAADVAAGRVREGLLATRAGLYAYAARGTAEEVLRQAFRRNGAAEERRVLGVADHCPDCIAYASLGWQPIGSLPRTTASRCRVHCKCRFEYR